MHVDDPACMQPLGSSFGRCFCAGSHSEEETVGLPAFTEVTAARQGCHGWNSVDRACCCVTDFEPGFFDFKSQGQFTSLREALYRKDALTNTPGARAPVTL